MEQTDRHTDEQITALLNACVSLSSAACQFNPCLVVSVAPSRVVSEISMKIIPGEMRDADWLIRDSLCVCVYWAHGCVV